MNCVWFAGKMVILTNDNKAIKRYIEKLEVGRESNVD